MRGAEGGRGGERLQCRRGGAAERAQLTQRERGERHRAGAAAARRAAASGRASTTGRTPAARLEGHAAVDARKLLDVLVRRRGLARAGGGRRDGGEGGQHHQRKHEQAADANRHAREPSTPAPGTPGAHAVLRATADHARDCAGDDREVKPPGPIVYVVVVPLDPIL